jgi:hypothetical protein
MPEFTEASLKRAIREAWEAGESPQVIMVPAGFSAQLRAFSAGWKFRFGRYWKWGRWPKTHAQIQQLYADPLHSGGEAYVSDYGVTTLKERDE